MFPCRKWTLYSWMDRTEETSFCYLHFTDVPSVEYLKRKEEKKEKKYKKIAHEKDHHSSG